MPVQSVSMYFWWLGSHSISGARYYLYMWCCIPSLFKRNPLPLSWSATINKSHWFSLVQLEHAPLKCSIFSRFKLWLQIQIKHSINDWVDLLRWLVWRQLLNRLETCSLPAAVVRGSGSLNMAVRVFCYQKYCQTAGCHFLISEGKVW